MRPGPESAANASRSAVSAWAPFASGAFALLWSATLVSNTGTWIHDVGAGWLMTTLNPSPAVVTLVQAAMTLPVFLFALLAGTLADRMDKRKLLIVVNLMLAVVVTLLAVLVAAERMTPLLLIVFTFLIGTGAAFVGPALQSVVPELVPRANLQPAIALNSMGMNISRAIGPAIAGFLIAVYGVAAPFVVNAASFVVIVIALVCWRRVRPENSRLPPEPLGTAMITGLRHAAHNGALKATLVRALGFFVFASAYWALLPLIARGLPGGGPELYGFLLASIGAGAVFGALLLPRFRKRFDTNRLAAAGVVLTAAAMAVLSLATLPGIAVAAAFTGGAGWITVLTGLNISAQTALPDWVRARGLAIFMMVFFGAMAAGSALWGQVATALSVDAALLIASAGALIAIPLTRRARLGQGEGLDLAPAGHWPSPVLHSSIEDASDRGPVMITIEYRIDPANEQDFVAALRTFSGERYRDGAYEWGAYQDAEDPDRWIEWFLVSSWKEHLRQHERATGRDRDLQAEVQRFHVDAGPPRVRHWLSPVRSRDA